MNFDSFLTTWNALGRRNQIVAGAAVGAVIVCILAIALMAGRTKEALLFSGLDDSAAGEIATELDGLNVPYTVKGSAIYVPENQRDRLRLEMARQGLPAAGGQGYELLDTLNGFSTTADMFDAAYWRAKEGELTRTITAMPQVKSARVHLGVTRQSAFRRSRENKSASVTITSPVGLSREQARSIQYLTALSVAELKPEMVAVIDSERGVLAGPGDKTEEFGAPVSATREQNLEQRLTRLLEAHVGEGNAEVTVALEIDRARMAQTERLIDPETREVASRSLVEETDMSESVNGLVTVASNLPDGDADEDKRRQLVRSKRNEQVVYTGTEIERVTERQAGSIARLSVAVLLNERFTEGDEGEMVLDPRSREELQALEALVASAAGIDTERGDSLTVRILPFEAVAEGMALAPTGNFASTYIFPHAVELIQVAVLGVIALVIGLFVVKPMLAPKMGGMPQLAEGAQGDPDQLAGPDGGPLAGLAEGELPKAAKPLDAVALLTMLTEENPDDAAAIIDAWFEEEDAQVA